MSSRWTEAEIDKLRELYGAGWTHEDIAEQMQKSLRSVQTMTGFRNRAAHRIPDRPPVQIASESTAFPNDRCRQFLTRSWKKTS